MNQLESISQHTKECNLAYYEVLKAERDLAVARATLRAAKKYLQNVRGPYG